MKKIYAIILITTFFIGCNSTKQKSEFETSVLGSTWEYSDEDITYQITFSDNGKLKNTHPNDFTLENDFWSQSGDQIHFESNSGFAKYDGIMKTINLIVGTS
jgi:hypothetical protein